MVKVQTKHHGIVEINVAPVAIPPLRLMSWHAGGLRIECKGDKGRSWLIPLAELDLSHDSLSRLNAAHLRSV